MSVLVAFDFKGKEVRVVQDDSGNPWWVAKDVCDVLELTNPSSAVDKLDDDERSKFNLGRQGSGWVVNESGLYTLILRSDKPQSKPFRKWVTSEVLPSIRKTGTYQAPIKQKPKTILGVDREFRAAIRMAKAAGLKDNQAVLSANRLTEDITGQAPLQLLQITHLEHEGHELHLTASDVGKRLGEELGSKISGMKANKILEQKGFQYSTRDHKDKIQWAPTKFGEQYSVLKDTGKKNSTGTPVLQLRWKDSVVCAIKEAS